MRTTKEISTDYGQACAELGQLQYTRDVELPQRQSEIFDQMSALETKITALKLENKQAVEALQLTESDQKGNK